MDLMHRLDQPGRYAAHFGIRPFRAHFEQKGNGTVQTFPVDEKNVASLCNSAVPHFRQLVRSGCAERASKSSSKDSIGTTRDRELSFATTEPRCERLRRLPRVCGTKPASLTGSTMAGTSVCGSDGNHKLPYDFKVARV